MTFELTPDQQQFLTRVRDMVTRIVTPMAADIDRTGEIPPALLGKIAEVIEPSATGPYRYRTGGAVLAAAVVVELAMGSTAVAAHVAMGAKAASPADLPGLRGAGAPSAVTDGHRLGMAAVAIGLGRAAIAEAVSAIRQSGRRPGDDRETPHWAIADAATGIESAWMLVLKAAQTMDRGQAAARDVGMARFMAGHAGEEAVLAALRVVGPTGYHRGALLERLTRDARTLLLSLGTPEYDRAIAAADLPT